MLRDKQKKRGGLTKDQREELLAFEQERKKRREERDGRARCCACIPNKDTARPARHAIDGRGITCHNDAND